MNGPCWLTQASFDVWTSVYIFHIYDATSVDPATDTPTHSILVNTGRDFRYDLAISEPLQFSTGLAVRVLKSTSAKFDETITVGAIGADEYSLTFSGFTIS